MKFCFFVEVLGFEFSPMLASQALYHLNQSSSYDESLKVTLNVLLCILKD
jgi:hypothetical protein